MNRQITKLEYKVGAFVAVGLVLAMASILILGGNRIAFTRYLRVQSYFEEVQGLFPGSVVSLAGLPVGNVERIEFSPDQSKLRVVMTIDRRFAPRITEGTTADVRTLGALGDKYVYLTQGPLAGRPLPEGATLVVNESGDILKMLSSKDDGVGQVIGLVKEMRATVAAINANGRIGGALDGASAATSQLKTTLAQMDGLLRDLRGQLPADHAFKAAVASLASVLAKVDQGRGTLGQLINDPSVHQRLKLMLGGSPRDAYLKNMIRESIQQSEAPKK